MFLSSAIGYIYSLVMGILMLLYYFISLFWKTIIYSYLLYDLIHTNV